MNASKRRSDQCLTGATGGPLGRWPVGPISSSWWPAWVESLARCPDIGMLMAHHPLHSSHARVPDSTL
eukprot:1002505-Prymnesium_polylepis.1